ncbi:MAG: glycogen synthase GlgA [Candidatus Helarchaeota archaeon]|nr:glycogen synthase GlgA [Candidatus Helarchaeota archaeon]
MNILFVTSEIVPYVKKGGLADVSGALSKTLEAMGHEIRVILPKYSKIETKKFEITPLSIKYNIANFEYEAEIEQTAYPSSKIIVYFIKCDHFYDRDEIYGNYKDNAERSIFFSKSVLELLKYVNWKPDIIHCNDWQTALIPALLKNLYNEDQLYQNIRILFTIHNLGYQGIFPKEKFVKTGLDDKLFTSEGLEIRGKLNLMKAGIIFADILNTVSMKYASEIQTKEFGFGLEAFLQKRKRDLYGIMNGIDYDLWDPRIDQYIWHKYDENSLEKKRLNKIQLQKESNLPEKDVPLIGIISRLVDQKGFDLIEEIIDELMQLDLQLILLGTGLPKYHKLFKVIGKKYAEKTAIYLKFDDVLTHKIEAGADFFLMPSYYEPCGLNQLISLRYGTIPIVRHTGGLADSISDITDSGVGVVFRDYQSEELLQAVQRALNLYQKESRMMSIRKRGMRKDFSWDLSAEKYEQLYQKALQKN